MLHQTYFVNITRKKLESSNARTKICDRPIVERAATRQLDRIKPHSRKASKILQRHSKGSCGLQRLKTTKKIPKRQTIRSSCRSLRQPIHDSRRHHYDKVSSRPSASCCRNHLRAYNDHLHNADTWARTNRMCIFYWCDTVAGKLAPMQH